MARRRQWSWPAVALLAVGAVGGAWVARTEPTRTTLGAGSPVEAPVPEPMAPREAPSNAGSSAPPPPPVSAGAPPGCPDDGEDDDDPPGFVRPAVWELLRWRTQELRDRLPQLSRDASPELRRGLHGLNDEDATGAMDALLAAPDRHRDGFDVALAAILHQGMRGLSERAGGARRNDGRRNDARRNDARRNDARRNDAEHHARAALRQAPDDPLAHALASLVAQHRHDSASARREMARAFALAPDEPALMLAHARLQADHGELSEALAAVDSYLAAVPEDRRIERWRERVATRRSSTVGHASRSASGVRVFHPDAVGAARVDALIEALRGSMDEVARMIHRPRRSELTVLIYADREAMHRATCAPSWSGGIFDGVLHLDVPTVLGGGFERTARHEAAHAQLALLRGRVPHWLNEGLAQHMEGAPSRAAIDAWRRMTDNSFWIPFASLEGELVVIDDPRDAALAYHQSLAMVRYLLHERGRGVIGEAAVLIERGEPEDLLGRLVRRRTVDGHALLAFLRGPAGG